MKDNRGSNPNSRANLRPAKKGDKIRVGLKKRPNKVKSIIRELLKCDSYGKIVANKALTKEIASHFGVENLSGIELILVAQIQKALTGDTKAFNALMDRMEGKPIQQVNNVNMDRKYSEFLESLSDEDDGEQEE